MCRRAAVEAERCNGEGDERRTQLVVQIVGRKYKEHDNVSTICGRDVPAGGQVEHRDRWNTYGRGSGSGPAAWHQKIQTQIAKRRIEHTESLRKKE